MIFGIDSFDTFVLIISLLFSTVLMFNIYTIYQLRKEKKTMSEDQKLLTQLLANMQGYFNKIDQGIDRIENEEEKLASIVGHHQEEEYASLEGLENNQRLFLNRLENIANAQQELFTRLEALTSGDLIEAKMMPFFTRMTQFQQEIGSNLEKTLLQAKEPLEVIESNINKQINDLTHELKSAINQNILQINQALELLQHKIAASTESFQNNESIAQHAKVTLSTLNEYIDIAHDNLKKLIDQSLDLNPIYKNLHTLMIQLEGTQKEYGTAKQDLHVLTQTLQHHEQNDLLELKNDVEGFLMDLKKQMNESVEILKKEFHLGQSQVTDTVKTLSERSQVKKAYGIDE